MGARLLQVSNEGLLLPQCAIKDEDTKSIKWVSSLQDMKIPFAVIQHTDPVVSRVASILALSTLLCEEKDNVELMAVTLLLPGNQWLTIHASPCLPLYTDQEKEQTLTESVCNADKHIIDFTNNTVDMSIFNELKFADLQSITYDVSSMQFMICHTK